MPEIMEFRLPDLGEGLEEAEIVEWLVAAGDALELNQEIASLETAKAIVQIPSPYTGTVVEVCGEPGDTLEVGAVFIRVEVVGAPAEPQPLVGYGDRGGATRRRRDTPSNGQATLAPTAPTAAARALAKPPVRKLAKDLGVDLAAVTPGSGEGRIITRDDVRQFVADRDAPAAAADDPADGATFRPTGEKAVPGFRGRMPGQVEKVARIRKRIISRMEQSRRDIPHALCSRDADLTALWSMRDDLTAQAQAQGIDVRISPTAIVMRATVVALRRFPTLNAVYAADAGEIRLLEAIHLGCAVDTDRGLMVPNVRDAHSKSLVQIAAELDVVASACRDGSVTPAQLTGGTFTVDNYGSFGNDDGNPIINPPEAGVLGLGAIRERPWVVDGQVAVRRVARFTLAFDHRICDGGEAGRFVTYVAQLCEQPSRMLLHV